VHYYYNYNRFTALWILSRTTRLSGYQKDKNQKQSGFPGARDSELQLDQLGYMQICTSPQIDNHANTPPLSFYRPNALPAAQPTASKFTNKVLYIFI